MGSRKNCHTCPLCDNIRISIVHNGVRDNDNIDVLACDSCSLVFLSEFIHSNNDFYQQSQMWNSNNEAMHEFRKWQKRTFQDDERRYNQYKTLISQKDILDFGCGNGGFLELCTQDTNSVAGLEMDNFAVKHLKAKNINVVGSIDELSSFFDYVFLFHVFEHLENPIEVLRSIARKMKPNGEIILETPNANDALLSIYNCDAFAAATFWSAHIILYNESTLTKMIEKAGMKIKWIKQYQRYPLANHLKWIQKGLPGGQNDEYALFDIENLNTAYSEVLSTHKACDTLICSVIS